jgi:murein DD-endopeptidase MepM/ murein hydrolase activator NlpD
VQRRFLAGALCAAVALSGSLQLPAHAHSGETTRRLIEIQATIDELTAPAARLYGLFVSTRHAVQAARIGTRPTRAMLHRYTRVVAAFRVPHALDPRRDRLAHAMLEHEVVKRALQQQNAYIQDAIHASGHLIEPLVARLQSTGEIRSAWAGIWPQPVHDGPLAMCPVAGPNSVIDTFGAPRSGGRHHEGNDLFAAQWTPVVAPADGTVRRYPNTLGGNAVLEDTATARFYFAHLVEYAAEGQVTAGTVIGYVGHTGNAITFPYHLHFQYEPGGVPVDPYPYLRDVC